MSSIPDEFIFKNLQYTGSYDALPTATSIVWGNPRILDYPVTLARSIDGWNFTFRTESTLVATHLLSKAAYVFSLDEVRALTEGCTSAERPFARCIVERDEDSPLDFRLRKLRSHSTRKRRKGRLGPKKGAQLSRRLIEYTLQSIEKVTAYFRDRDNPGNITCIDYCMNAHELVETVVAFMAFRLIGCSDMLKDDDACWRRERDCFYAYEERIACNAPVSLQEVEDVLGNSCGIPPSFSFRLYTVFRYFSWTLGLDLNFTYVQDVYDAMTSTRIRELVNTRVLKLGCDDVISFFLREHLEIYRDCWCFVDFDFY